MNHDSQKLSVPFRWQLNTKLLLFTLIFLPVTVALGFWQLDRETEKREILEQLEQRQELGPVAVGQIDLTIDQNYLPVIASGRFDQDRYFLLENRIRDGRPGYEVLTPVYVENTGDVLLVNRGWVLASQDRAIFPDIVTPERIVRLSGYLYRSSGGAGFLIGDEIWRNEWPERVISADISQLEERLGEPLAAYQFRLDQNSDAGLQTGWEIVTVYPEKHRGYAVQWFMMAAALCLLTLFASSNMGIWLKSQFGKRSKIDE